MKRHARRPGLLAAACAAAVAMAGCGRPPAAAPAADLDAALAQIDTGGLLAHISALASDEFGGRLPGTAGEDRTVDYLGAQFRKLGLEPGNPDGRYVQTVPLVGIDSRPELSITVAGKPLPLALHTDYVASTTRFAPEVSAEDSGLVFVGYGVQAPEYAWDDYKGLDVRGKTLVMLVNDPPIPDPGHPERLDDRLFKGRAMTYYGRWTYKYEIAAQLGAAGAIIVHETAAAAYPWAVVQNSWSGEQFSLANPDQNRSRLALQAWITTDKARELFAAAGQDFAALKTAALSRDFRPVVLPATASFRLQNTIRAVQSHNVIARLPGSDPALAGEYVIYTAHWDHLGTHAQDGATEGSDHVFNGAVDNATGTAAVLEIAQALKSLKPAPRRSVLFLAVTAEEQGLLGSRYYAENPLYPLERTVAAINIDSMNVWGPTRDIQVIGAGQNTLEDELARVLERRGRVTVPDEHPEKGAYFRSDQFHFARLGVPALYADEGSDVIGKPGYGESKRAAYTANDYHKASDEVHPDWDLTGTVADTRALCEVGYAVANAGTWPTWKDGSEFKARREAMLAARH